MTVQALRRSPDNAESFPQDVQEIQEYFAAARAGQLVQAVRASG